VRRASRFCDRTDVALKSRNELRSDLRTTGGVTFDRPACATPAAFSTPIRFFFFL
jgi:hypothetical protein